MKQIACKPGEFPVVRMVCSTDHKQLLPASLAQPCKTHDDVRELRRAEGVRVGSDGRDAGVFAAAVEVAAVTRRDLETTNILGSRNA